MRLIYKQKILSVCILALFAFITLPREYFTEDLVIHVPIVLMRMDANLFSSDYVRFFRLPDLNPSIYYPVLEVLLRVFFGHMQLLFAFLRLSYFMSLFFILFLLSIQFQISFFAYTVFILLLTSHIQIGGSAVSILESEFLPRGFGLVLVFCSYYLFLVNKWKIGLLTFIAATLIHGITAFFAILISAIVLLYRSQNKLLYRVALTFFICVCFAIWILVPPVDSVWLSILRMRNSYAFIDAWSIKSWINLGFTLTSGVLNLFVTKTRSELRSMIVPIYAGAFILLLIQFLFTFGKPIYPAILLQLGRVWLFPALVSFIVLAQFISNYLRRWNKALIVISIGLLVIFVNNRPQIKVQAAQLQPWLKTQIWARYNTNQNCVFLVPFYSKGFRVESRRSIIGEFKDGTLSFYSRDFALDWMKRLELLHNWEQFNFNEMLELAKLYQFDYFILRKEKQFTDFPVSYANDAFVVQSISFQPKCESNL